MCMVDKEMIDDLLWMLEDFAEETGNLELLTAVRNAGRTARMEQSLKQVSAIEDFKKRPRLFTLSTGSADVVVFSRDKNLGIQESAGHLHPGTQSRIQ